jgi:ABC-type lipoprotein export system ATPase subunit/histidinol phosphatase-like PHP family hydrolase
MEEIENLSFGADFVRADLHIHSYSPDDGSFDVKDEGMTPENIVDTSIENNLSIISITDHNEINNSKKAISYSEEKNILVIPGIEISTTQGHLLVYFEEFSELRKFFGKLNISDDKERCTQGIVECLDLAKQYGGLGVLAHIELDSGFEKMIGRFSDVIKDIYIHPSLYALEISKKSSLNYYTDSDDSNERKTLVKIRREKLQLAVDHTLPKLMSSDSHTLDKLGVNAEGDKKLTRIKVDSLSFPAFKNALISHESRIRLEDCIPNSIPYIVGLKIRGGLLDSQSVRLSKNLTCIIGGRGTGKSTLLESIREASGNKSTAKIVDSEVWPEEIDLLFEDETGQQFHFKREKNDSAYNVTDSVNGINTITIESYGQGETAETIQHSDENPKVLLDFLDDFLDVKMLLEEDRETRELILENQSELGKSRIEVKSIPDIRRQIANLEGKKKRLEKDKVGDLVKYQSFLIAERSIRDNLIKELKELVDKYKDVLNDDEAFEYFSKMSGDNIVIGKQEFEKVKTIIDEFSKIVSTKSDELSSKLNIKIDELKVQLTLWKSKESDIQKTIDEKKAELDAQGIPFDIGKINQIAKDLEHYNSRIRKLNDTEKNIGKLEEERKTLINKRKEIKGSIYKQRFAFSIKVNENLKNSVDGLMVAAKYIEGCYSPSFENSIKQLMDWRTSQVPKSTMIADAMSPMNFSDCVKRNDLSNLKEINDEDGKRAFPDADINNILDKSRQNNCYEDFEALEYDDKPTLKVTKVLEDNNGEKVIITRSLAQLSLGQQQSILLAILLQSKSTNPLLIDQPEDNLDSEFIYKTIVDNLRKIKEKRQIIIVTHNPNIAVLGDAELIIPLKSTSVKTHIMERGSIDRKEIRDLCCDILEGGKQAFISRQKLYGITE